MDNADQTRGDYFGWGKGTTDLSICAYCVHFKAGGVCEAFPDGIPASILTMEDDHHNPIEGDHGIQFELKPGWTLPERKQSHFKR